MDPVCSFCGTSPVVAWFEGPSFTVPVAAADEVRAEEAWLVCDPCLQLLRADDRERITQRGASARHIPIGSAEAAHERFWDARKTDEP